MNQMPEEALIDLQVEAGRSELALYLHHLPGPTCGPPGSSWHCTHFTDEPEACPKWQVAQLQLGFETCSVLLP